MSCREKVLLLQDAYRPNKKHALELCKPIYPEDKFHFGNQSDKSQFTENCSITFMVLYHEDSNVAVSNNSFRSLQ